MQWPSEASAHLGDPFGTDEAAGLDVDDACAGQPVDELNLDVDGDGALLILEAIARTDLHQSDQIRVRSPLEGAGESWAEHEWGTTHVTAFRSDLAENLALDCRPG